MCNVYACVVYMFLTYLQASMRDRSYSFFYVFEAKMINLNILWCWGVAPCIAQVGRLSSCDIYGDVRVVMHCSHKREGCTTKYVAVMLWSYIRNWALKNVTLWLRHVSRAAVGSTCGRPIGSVLKSPNIEGCSSHKLDRGSQRSEVTLNTLYLSS